MRFIESQGKATVDLIEAVEARLSIRLPLPLRQSYLRANGGSPEPYVYDDGKTDTAVSGFLPLTSLVEDELTAEQAYNDLVVERRIVPRRYFPFAVDGGGDFFFVDCASAEGTVSFYRADMRKSDRLRCLGIGIDAFWESLKDED